MNRIYNLDKIRGFTILSMVLFHLMYNINFYRRITRYDDTILNRIWQLSIALSFFLISGITSNLLKAEENIKRGILTSFIGLGISFITYFFAKDQLIIWGVMNGLGLSMIIGGMIQKRFNFHLVFAPIFLFLFTLTYNIPRFILDNIKIFDYMYSNNFFILGFPSKDFISADYFPIIPWIFAYLSGVSLGNHLKTNNFYYRQGKNNTLAMIGRHSMAIYLTHQIILYPLVSFFLS